MAGFTAFREAYLSAGLVDTANSDFADFDARRLRYNLYWALYENTAYRNVHSWSVLYRQQQALYKYIRGIYNPSYRLGEFWKSHLWGGRLDPDAGDGSEIPTALPIVADNQLLRPALSQLWKWSNWQINKGIASLYGAILGDVALQIVDDTERQKVYLKIVHPGIIKDVTLDDFGNVKGYEIEERRVHPYDPQRTAVYLEKASRDGDNVIYQTFMDDALFAWYGQVAEWEVPYGFVPMVMIQHNNVGLDWGWSEVHSGRPKFQEVDDLASKLSDQIRKMVDAPWLFAGINKPTAAPRTAGTTPTSDMPQPGREEMNALYGPSDAKAQPLVAPLDISATAQYIKELLSELERDYPELQMDIWTAGGDTSGRALRIARQRVETKVNERRPLYDDGLVRAQQMAVAIGGYRNYEGFESFGLDSYKQGQLDHKIGERDVFKKDPFDDSEKEMAFWSAAEKAVKTGLPLMTFLKRNGWDEQELKDLEKSPEMQAKLANLKMSKMMADNFDPNQQEGGNQPFGGNGNNNQNKGEQQ
jgi:hypothetical protein